MAVCPHGIPLSACPMQSYENFSFAHYLLLYRFPNVKTIIADTACKLGPSFRNLLQLLREKYTNPDEPWNRHDFQNISFQVDFFHSMVHDILCRCKFVR